MKKFDISLIDYGNEVKSLVDEAFYYIGDTYGIDIESKVSIHTRHAPHYLIFNTSIRNLKLNRRGRILLGKDIQRTFRAISNMVNDLRISTYSEVSVQNPNVTIYWLYRRGQNYAFDNFGLGVLDSKIKGTHDIFETLYPSGYNTIYRLDVDCRILLSGSWKKWKSPNKKKKIVNV